MTTTSGPTLGPQTQTHVKDMPPLVVTTTGIPDAEHHAEAPTTEPKQRLTTWVAVAVAGILAVALAAVAYIVTQPVEPEVTAAPTSASSAERADYVAGKRAAAAHAAGIHPLSYIQQAQLDRLEHYPVW